MYIISLKIDFFLIRMRHILDNWYLLREHSVMYSGAYNSNNEDPYIFTVKPVFRLFIDNNSILWAYQCAFINF